jgi:hypothetical protein
VTATAWQVQGQYYETCSCDFVCMCVPAQLMVKPTKGSCTFVMAFQIERGRFGELSLDGLGFIIVGVTPEEMGKGNWSVGVVVDERATAGQRDAITGIASGAAGGPISALSGLVGTFLGVETAPIEFRRNGVSWSVNASNLIRMSAEGASGLNPAAPPMQLTNTGHPATDTFTLAKASHSHVAVLGVSWDDASGTNNGQYAPFAWQSA